MVSALPEYLKGEGSVHGALQLADTGGAL
jgi:hypothetical protein